MGARLTLASRSPQRRAILTQLGVEFTVVVPGVEETEEGDPRQLVVENALRKQQAVTGERVLGVDTTVALDGRSFGKPATPEEARATLEALAGRTHEVHSGIALNGATALATTSVRFRPGDDRLLDWYIAGEEWRERAGGYAIQGRGAALVEAIEGDFWNVVGLPVPALLGLAPDLLD